VGVGRLCREGLVIVFDATGSHIYGSDDFRVVGKRLNYEKITSDGFYPVKENKYNSPVISADRDSVRSRVKAEVADVKDESVIPAVIPGYSSMPNLDSAMPDIEYFSGDTDGRLLLMKIWIQMTFVAPDPERPLRHPDVIKSNLIALCEEFSDDESDVDENPERIVAQKFVARKRTGS